jgi:ABC-type nitrate/sulfonate/bicarbonate transport system permease component
MLIMSLKQNILKKPLHRNNSHGRAIKYVLPLFIVLAVWQLIYQLGVYNSIFLPPPSKLLKTFISLVLDGTLIANTFSSLGRVFLGWILGSVLGLLVGFSISEFALVKWFFKPFIDLLHPIPNLAWIPLVILWFGLGNGAAVFIIALASFWSIVLNLDLGISSLNKNYVKIAKTLGAKKWYIFKNVVIPGSFPFIITGLRMGFSRSWRALIAGEMIVATSSGLGYMIFNARNLFRTDEVLVGMLVIGIISLMTENIIFKKIEKHTLEKWGVLNDRYSE